MTSFDELINALLSSGFLWKFLQFLLWTVFILFIAWLVQKAIQRSIINNSSRYRARKITRFSSYVLILLLAVVTFTTEVRYFTVAIGLISAGLAFALQEVVLSLAGWISIRSSGLYKPGDRIEMNGVKGDVIDIGLVRTTLMEIGEWVQSDNYSGRIVQLSNAFVFKGPVRNYSGDFPFLWDEIRLPVRYGSDLELAGKLISDTAEAALSEYARFAKAHWREMVGKYLIENAVVEPTLSVKLTDNWAEFTLRFVVDYKKRRLTKDKLYCSIIKAIEATNGKVTLASTTFEVIGVPPITVIPGNRDTGRQPGRG